MNELQCCVCKKTVKRVSQNKVDPCGLILVSNFDKDFLEQGEQTFFCHYECFRTMHNDDGTLYLKEIEPRKVLLKEKKDIKTKFCFLGSLFLKSGKREINAILQQPKGEWFLLEKFIKSQKINEIVKKLRVQMNDVFVMWAEYSCDKEKKKMIYFSNEPEMPIETIFL